MTDQELLEAAAKAAGFAEAEWQDLSGWGEIRYGLSEAIWTGEDYWNPLADDGDALRLAVKLNLGISIPVHRSIRADVVSFLDPSVSIREGGDDPAAATRRAIVRAAAEVGMKR